MSNGIDLQPLFLVIRQHPDVPTAMMVYLKDIRQVPITTTAVVDRAWMITSGSETVITLDRVIRERDLENEQHERGRRLLNAIAEDAPMCRAVRPETDSGTLPYHRLCLRDAGHDGQHRAFRAGHGGPVYWNRAA